MVMMVTVVPAVRIAMMFRIDVIFISVMTVTIVKIIT